MQSGGILRMPALPILNHTPDKRVAFKRTSVNRCFLLAALSRASGFVAGSRPKSRNQSWMRNK